jgi:riboflavin kinase/FMN adenylyltransferase
MKLLTSRVFYESVLTSAVLAGRKSVVTIGNFDGCHLGHQALLQALRNSRDNGIGSVGVVVTFDPHPSQALGLIKGDFYRLQSLKDRVQTLLDLGGDDLLVWVCRFNQKIASLTPEAFVKTLLKADLNASRVIVGEDFRFGAKRVGDVAMLRALGMQSGFDVVAVPAVLDKGMVVSSTRIREALTLRGDLQEASRLLGRPWIFEAQVTHGQKLGRTLGFPTANLDLGPVTPPLEGVYAARVSILDNSNLGTSQVVSRPFMAVMNIGYRPTVSERGAKVVEVHLLDESSIDLYDKTLRVEPVGRLRDEKRFSGVEELRSQITLDCATARTLLR